MITLQEKLLELTKNQKKKKLDVIEEKPLTLFLNDQEILTMMTVNDFPKYLALGYLLNQNMISKRTKISKVEYDDDLNVVIVRTKKKNSYPRKIKKKNSYVWLCSRNIIWDLMDNFSKIKFNIKSKIKISWIYELSKAINLTPSLYLKAGAIHGCVLCKKNKPLIYMEDVGRHNAIDKIAGYMMLKNKLI